MSVATVLQCGDVVSLGGKYVCVGYIILDQCDESPPCLCSLSVRMVV